MRAFISSIRGSRWRLAWILGLVLVMLASGVVAAQFQDYGGFRRRSRRHFDADEEARHRNGVPSWEVDRRFPRDVFTFVRIRYTSRYERWGRPDWAVDFPDSDLNLSFRLQQLTSMEVDPDGKVLRLTDPELCDYPFAYLIEPGRMSLTQAEVEGLRHYLERGGFVMVDDFWGRREWRVFESEMKRVFPNREIVDVPLEHEIFHIVYELEEKPQIPSIGHYMRGYRTETYDAPHANYRAIMDDDGRIMMMICHNTDLGDGWEREGDNRIYFKECSERFAYPLGINIVTYAMTH